ncbi:MAG TPA: hypothetical protein VEJ41_02935 [Candidatus Acidoferrales bacterium]|nr:hypothetical protein [Candidatus Acidoferrales bacterium]
MRTRGWKSLAIATLLLVPSFRALAQPGDVYDSGSGQNQTSQTLKIEISQAATDLDHGLAIEIESERTTTGAEDIWKRSSATVAKYEPPCYVYYNSSHNLIPELNAEFLAHDYAGANETAKQAAAFLDQAEKCSNKPLIAQGRPDNPAWGPYYVPAPGEVPPKDVPPADNPTASDPDRQPLPPSQSVGGRTYQKVLNKPTWLTPYQTADGTVYPYRFANGDIGEFPAYYGPYTLDGNYTPQLKYVSGSLAQAVTEYFRNADRLIHAGRLIVPK